MNTTEFIPSISIVTTGVIVFISLFVPVIVSSICIAGKFINPKAYFYGFGIFALGELLFRAPIISALSTDDSFREFALSTVGLIVVGGVTAGMIDETLKYVCVGKFLKKDISYNTALSFGLGTLCCEFIFVTGVNHIGSLIKMIVISNKSPEEIMNLEGASQLIAEINAVTPVDLIFDLSSGISKAMFTLMASVLIMKGVKQKNPLMWLLCIVLHTAFNCVLILISNQYVANGIAIFLGFMFMMYTILSKDEFEVRERKEDTEINSEDNYEKIPVRNKKNIKRKQPQRNTSQHSKAPQKKRKKKNISSKNMSAAEKMILNSAYQEKILLSNESSGVVYDTVNMKKNKKEGKKSETEQTVSHGQDIRSIYKQNMNRM